MRNFSALFHKWRYSNSLKRQSSQIWMYVVEVGSRRSKFIETRGVENEKFSCFFFLCGVTFIFKGRYICSLETAHRQKSQSHNNRYLSDELKENQTDFLCK